jgi:uncharacterized delta-60 repeat protein
MGNGKSVLNSAGKQMVQVEELGLSWLRSPCATRGETLARRLTLILLMPLLCSCGGGGGGGNTGSTGGSGGGGGPLAGVSGRGVANSIAIDSSGQISAVGYGQASNGTLEMRLWRYSANGNLDTTFNSQGYVSHPGDAGNSGTTVGLGVATDGVTGKIVVCGYSFGQDGLWGMTLWRYNANGTLDTTFNGNGYLRDSGRQGGGVSCAIDGSGRIAVAGFAWNGATWDAALWLYRTNGQLDASVATFEAPAGGEDIALGLTFDSAGKILLTGYVTNSSGNQDLAVWRYNATGTLDTSFNGGAGYVTHSNAGGAATGDDVGRAITVDGAGRIVVAGWTRSASAGDDMALWRFTSSGALDIAFGGTGIRTHNGAAGGSSTDEGRAVQVDSGGRIVVAGSSTDRSARTRAVLWRYTSGGQLDTTFSSTGYVVFPASSSPAGNDGGRALALDGVGRVWEVGFSTPPGSTPQVGLWSVSL